MTKKQQQKNKCKSKSNYFNHKCTSTADLNLSCAQLGLKQNMKSKIPVMHFIQGKNDFLKKII